MAQAIPVLERVTRSFFSVAPSPWKSRSPILTCSMHTSSKALSCSSVCFSLWANARSVPEVASMTSRPRKTPSAVSTYRVPFIASSLRGRKLRRWSFVGAVVRPLAIGNPWAQDLVHVIPAPGVPRCLGEDVFFPPHHILVLDLLGRGHGEPGPPHSVEVVAGIDPHQALGQRGHAFRRVGPRPRGGEHADRAHLSDLVIERLVGMTVDVGDVGVGIEDLVNLPPVAYHEVHGRGVIVE